MQAYINNLRKLGYIDYIQVVKIRLKKNTVLIAEKYYDFNKKISKQINLNEYNLSAIDLVFDPSQKTEILYLEFSNFTKLELETHKEDKQIISKKPYWAQIRKFIGHSVVYSSSCVVIIERDNKILAVKRSDDGMWSLPAGAKELGDHLDETARKEVLEEVGVEISNLKLIAVQTGKDMFWKYPNGNKMHYISFVWKAQTSGEPKISDPENTEVSWISIEKAKVIFEPRWLNRLDYFLKYNQKIIID